MKKIRKAIIPAAGFGTRFLPQTKAMPKEMLPIVDKPVIQQVVEEAVEAGIEDIVIVTGWHKRTIEDHFDYPFELIQRLRESGKESLIQKVEKSADLANFVYIRQKGGQGNAVPMWNARNVIGDEPFLYLWGDDFVISPERSRVQQLIDAYEIYGTSILSTMKRTSEADAKQFGYIGGEEIGEGTYKVTSVIEKPGMDKRPSENAIFSGYIFTPEIFDCIEYMLANNITGPGNEYVYTDALNIMLERGHDVHAIEIRDSQYFDTGTKIEYMKTVTQFALKHPEIGDSYRDFLKSLEL